MMHSMHDAHFDICRILARSSASLPELSEPRDCSSACTHGEPALSVLALACHEGDTGKKARPPASHRPGGALLTSTSRQNDRKKALHLFSSSERAF